MYLIVIAKLIDDSYLLFALKLEVNMKSNVSGVYHVVVAEYCIFCLIGCVGSIFESSGSEREKTHILILNIFIDNSSKLGLNVQLGSLIFFNDIHHLIL